MKKLLTILSLISVLSLSVFAQDNDGPAGKNFKPGFGPGHGQENCNGMGPMQKGMKGNCGKDWQDDDFDGRRGNHFGPMIVEQLELSNEQIDQIHKIKIKYDKMDIDLKAELQKLRIDKHEAMTEMNFDKAKEVTKKMAEIRTKTQMGNIDEMIELTKVLTKEQQEKMKDFHKAPGMMKHKMMNKEK